MLEAADEAKLGPYEAVVTTFANQEPVVYKMLQKITVRANSWFSMFCTQLNNCEPYNLDTFFVEYIFTKAIPCLRLRKLFSSTFTFLTLITIIDGKTLKHVQICISIIDN